MRPSVFIFSTGTELSTGRSIDTNAPFLARSLAERGFAISGFATLPDDAAILRAEIQHALARPEVDGIIMTGGLGPTEDDLTIDVLAALAGADVIEDETALRKLTLLARRYPNRIVLENTRRQTRVLKDHRALVNERGLAPGVFVELPVEGRVKWIAAMPGVPQEMELMFRTELLPLIVARYPAPDIHRRVAYVYGVGESNFEARLFGGGRRESDTPPHFPRASLPADFNWGITASSGHLKAFFESKDENLLEQITNAVMREYPNEYAPDLAEALLHQLCTERGLSFGAAESCTGGLVGKIVTDRPGSSAYFRGSIVAYHNDVKRALLGVPEALLIEHGAVSAECARAMAIGAQRALDTDFAVSLTGVAGPDGGTAAKPVGLVHMAIADRNGIVSERVLNYSFDRERIRNYAAAIALYDLYRVIARVVAAS